MDTSLADIFDRGVTARILDGGELCVVAWRAPEQVVGRIPELFRRDPCLSRVVLYFHLPVAGSRVVAWKRLYWLREGTEEPECLGLDPPETAGYRPPLRAARAGGGEER
jgi:hypothetical protein